MLKSQLFHHCNKLLTLKWKNYCILKKIFGNITSFTVKKCNLGEHTTPFKSIKISLEKSCILNGIVLKKRIQYCLYEQVTEVSIFL